jgi:hypothetical protein
MVKNGQNELVIEGFNVRVVKKMLKFAYYDGIDLGKDPELVEELLMAAGKYGVDKLKVTYFRYLEWKLLFKPVVRLFSLPISMFQPHVDIVKSPSNTNAWNYVRKAFSTSVKNMPNSINVMNLRACYGLIPKYQRKFVFLRLNGHRRRPQVKSLFSL